MVRLCCVFFGLFLVACQGLTRAPEQPPSEDVMMAKLSIIRSYHRRSAVALSINQREEALNELDHITKMKFPPTFRAGQEAVIDAWTRKASLLLKFRRPNKALATVEEAIAQMNIPYPSFYFAHLYHVRGRILEELGRQNEALQSYQQSIDINKRVIKSATKSQKKSGQPTVRKKP